ncbi:uncharacterized protein CC84DRAFT_1165905 [Paraphaeosphaeria sporulosa]|uniref:Uncharacterized protein n=1 Tax=Paraphaeosphaeria sporulosa TaxID=1460663 RepID=A0A177CA63_9PLEO|nr:uncharacterized protein CC84DRAFT_1165905 [Paraphaeosphaeria sporulosa]OAG03719.1 hypothetical protein CC84DRAFT_1165905 [Paraphaeosphaeria sporulosa]
MAFRAALASVLAFSPAIQASSLQFIDDLNFTSPSPHIAHSLSALLSVHPQTLFPNGHTIASATIPRHTLLYHGRHDDHAVPSPEWLAFDVYMAYAIMGNTPDSRMLTFRLEKDIKAVYFDGASANLMGDGTWSQMVFIKNGTEGMKRPGWVGPPRGGRPPRKGKDGDSPPRRPPGGHPPEHWNPLADEYFRARELCKWLKESGLGGKGWGYEAIVRMNAGFELIWCDFESPSLELVSNLNVSAPQVADGAKPAQTELQQPYIQRPIQLSARDRLETEDEGPNGPGMSDPREPFRNTSTWFWFSAAAKRYAGDARIRLDAGGVFSFYEPGLQNQSRVRVAEDIERFGLRRDGRWRSTPFMGETGREQKLLDLQRRRRQHRLTSVDRQDAQYMRQAVEQRLRNNLHTNHDGSGIDWVHIAKEIVTRYSDELKTLLSYVSSDIPNMDEHDSLKEWLATLRQLTHWFLLPFFEYPSSLPYEDFDLAMLFGTRSPQAQAALDRCVTQYTVNKEHIHDADVVFSHAITGTLHALCSTAIKIGLHVEYHWFMYFQPADPSAPPKPLLPHILKGRAMRWKLDLQELIAWLGWAEQDVGCEEECGVGEYCYVPMWPVNGWERHGGPSGGESRHLWEGVCVGMERYPPEQWEE